MQHDFRAALFDLDGTLLPMDQDEFTKGYFKLLVKKLAPHGYEPEALEILKQKNADAEEAKQASGEPLAKDYDFNSKTPDLLMNNARVYTIETHPNRTEKENDDL